MQLLRLIFIILVRVFLSTTTIDALAASVVRSGNEQKTYHAHIKEKAPNNLIDVWERIRLGLKIPSPASKLSAQTTIPEKSNAVTTTALRSVPSTPETEAMIAENPPPTSPQKYILHPNTAIAPVNNYTALGLRLKFGTKTPSSNNDNCIPSISAQNQQEHPLKYKVISTEKINSIPIYGANPQLRKRTVLAPPNHDILQTKPEMTGSLAQTTHNSTPCFKRTDQDLVFANKQTLQTQVAEQNNTKKAIIINARINKQIALLSQSPRYLYQVAERAHPYLYHIVEGLSKNKLPLDLALLPIVESGYQPTALSPKGAAGLWQFIPSTGRDYDLKQSNHYDDRLDILASTQAAIRFLSDLKDHFNGDWLLALAAYNCGQGAVDKAINRNLSDGLDADYWSLRLPEETQDYVPRLLALSNIFSNPAIYGLKFSPIKNEPYFVKVKINREVDIKYLTDKNFAVLAKLANLSHEQFCRLNPGYLNPPLSTQQSYTFLLPLANANQLHQLLTSIAQFMAEPVSPAMSSSNSEFKTLDYSWNLSPNASSINLIKFSQLSKDI